MQNRCEVINIFSVILNMEDTASSAYAVVADSIADGEEILENVQEYEILSVEPLVQCKDCRYFLGSDAECALMATRLHFYEKDKRWTEESYCSWGERK